MKPAILMLFLCLTIVGLPSTGQAQDNSFSVEGVQELIAAYDRADAARDRAEPGSEEWTALSRDAIAAREEVISYVGRWRRSGTMPPEVEQFTDETILILQEQNVRLLVSIGECAEARGRIRAIEILVDHADSEAAAAFRDTERLVERCIQAESSDVRAADTTPPAPMVAQAPGSSERSSNVVAWSLVGAGGATLIGSAVYWLVLSDYDSRFRPIQEACQRVGPDQRLSDPVVCTPDNFEEGERLRKRLNTGVPLNVGLTIAGAALTGTGVTLLLLNRNGGEGRAEVHPIVAPGFAGLQLRQTF